MNKKMIILIGFATVMANFNIYAGEEDTPNADAQVSESLLTGSSLKVPEWKGDSFDGEKDKLLFSVESGNPILQRQTLTNVIPWGNGNELNQRLYGSVNLLCAGVAKAMNERDFKSVVKNTFSVFHALYDMRRHHIISKAKK